MNNLLGIYLMGSECSHNLVTNNSIMGNGYGVGIMGDGYLAAIMTNLYPIDNSFYLNRFINNSLANALALSKNNWDNGKVGNYWDDYDGYDKDGDGIGDIPYGIPPFEDLNKDRYPVGRFLTNVTPPVDTFSPVIKIIFPVEGCINFGEHYWIPPYPIAKKYWGTAIVIGKVHVKVKAIDYETSVKKVEFYVDNETEPREIEFKQSPEQYIYRWVWKETMLWEDHTIKAVAYDEAGNKASATIHVKVFCIHLPELP